MTEITREQVIEAMTDAIGMATTRIYVRSMYKDRAQEIAEAALTAIEDLGLKIVPYELTDEMYGAAPWIGVDTLRSAYKAMLSASPLYREEKE